MSSRSSDYVSIVERCYDPLEQDQEWLSMLFDAASPLLDLGGGIGFSLVREGPQGRRIALSNGMGRIRDLLAASWPIIEQLDEPIYRSFYYPSQPVVLASQTIVGTPAHIQQLFRQTLALAGAHDLLGMLGYPAPGWAFALYVALGEQPLDQRVRETLRRLRIHVEASFRLRMLADSDAAAVLRPDGKVEHLSDGIAAGEELSAQAASIESVRTRAGRADPHHALSVWQALVNGRWSVVERVDSDGKRYYHAFENAPHIRTHRSLTETESLVLGLALRGLAGKEIAYSTGLSQSRISSALALAAERLGFANRDEMLRMGAALLGEDSSLKSAELTQAEREVMDLVRRGLSNREIAAKRETSVHTVANQIASLLRKTGAGNRRALIVSAEHAP